MCAGERLARDAAEAVGRAAYARGSLDNISVTVVRFGWLGLRAAQRLLAERRQKQSAENTEDIDMFA